MVINDNFYDVNKY